MDQRGRRSIAQRCEHLRYKKLEIGRKSRVRKESSPVPTQMDKNPSTWINKGPMVYRRRQKTHAMGEERRTKQMD